MKALILAAGYGTRLASVIADTPKPLIPIGNRPLIDYVVDKLQHVKSINEIVVVSNNKFTPHFQKWATTRPGKLPIRVVNDGTNTPEERLDQWGTSVLSGKKKLLCRIGWLSEGTIFLIKICLFLWILPYVKLLL